jgi:small subunit ribosomal protein S9
MVEKVEKRKILKVNQEVNYYGTGRRKNAIARVWVMPGSGKVEVNGREMTDFTHGRLALNEKILRPLVISNTNESHDVVAKTKGGGVVGQTDAIAHGMSRALLKLDPDLRKALKNEGLLTRDPRMKETKKYGHRGARKSPQYRKR